MYAELCARYPSNGSGFSYVYSTFGELAAWIVGWNIILFYGASASGLSRALVSYIVGFFNKYGVAIPKWIYSIDFFGKEDCNLLAALLLGVICIINCLGTK
jgi:basic amino acid/polyamine antiporter, APA family